MPDDQRRRFTIFDAMILIAATAVAMATIRHLSWPASSPVLTPPSDVTAQRRVMACTMLYFWSMAVIALRLLRPRPPRQHLRRQPGLIAGLVVILSSLNQALWVPLGILRLIPTDDFLQYAYFFLGALFDNPNNGSWIALAWIVMAVSGVWEPEAGWIDRLGRTIGCLWICLHVLFMFQLYLGF